MPTRTPRVVPPVFVDRMPEVICDADGVLITNQLGDTVHGWRMSRHRALNIASLIVAAVSKYERERGTGNVTPINPEADPPRAHRR